MIKNVSIDVTKIDKTKLRDGKYLELSMFDLKAPVVKTKWDKEAGKFSDTPIVSSTGKTLMKNGFVTQNGVEGDDAPSWDLTSWVETKADSLDNGFDTQPNYPKDSIDPESIPF